MTSAVSVFQTKCRDLPTPALSVHRPLLHPDSVRLKPLGMTSDWCGGHPAAVAEVSPQAGKDGEASSLGRREGVRASGYDSADLPAGCLRAASLKPRCAGSDVQPESVVPSAGEEPRPAAAPMHRPHFSAAMPSDPTRWAPVVGLSRAFVWLGKR